MKKSTERIRIETALLDPGWIIVPVTSTIAQVKSLIYISAQTVGLQVHTQDLRDEVLGWAQKIVKDGWEENLPERWKGGNSPVMADSEEYKRTIENSKVVWKIFNGKEWFPAKFVRNLEMEEAYQIGRRSIARITRSQENLGVIMIATMKGILVKNRAGELGIVTDDNRDKVLILMGDGLTIEDDKINWTQVPFSPNNIIPACFVELLPAYQYAPDIRGKLRDLENNNTTFESVLESLKSEIREFERRIKDLEGIKEETTKKLEGES